MPALPESGGCNLSAPRRNPSLATKTAYGEVPANGQVRAIFLDEDDEEQIRANYRRRDGEDQPTRARVSWRVSEWLRQEAERLGVLSIPARPLDTLLERTIATVDTERRLSDTVAVQTG